METIEEKMKRLSEENKPLEIENKELREKVEILEDASFGSPEALEELQARLRAASEQYNGLVTTVERQDEEIKTVHPELRTSLEKSEKEKSLLQQEVETLHQEVEALEETLQQSKLRIQTALNNLTPGERYIYNYIVQEKGTVDIAQLMKITGHTADDIFKIFDDLESKGLIGRNERNRAG